MRYKLSYYSEFSDSVSAKDVRVVHSTRTGRSLLIDPVIFEQLTSGQIGSIEASMLEMLKDAEIVVDADEDELEIVKQRFLESKSKPSDVLSFVIHPVAGCQLDCSYCGQRHQTERLNVEDYDKILARMTEKIERRKYRELHICWFGGEPILGKNAIEELTVLFRSLASKHQCSYSAKMVTNGQYLTLANFEKLCELGIRKFEITLDGPKEIHDIRRITKTGQGSFDDIIGNLETIVKSDLYKVVRESVEIVVRTNVDQNNYRHVMSLVDILLERGILLQISNFYFAPVYSWGNDAHLVSLEPQVFADLEVELGCRLLKLGMKNSYLGGRRYRWNCVIHHEEAEVIDATGSVSCCTEVSYVKQYNSSDYYVGRLGKAFESAVRPTQNFYDGFFKNEECRKCKVLPLCGGGCVKQFNEGNMKCYPLKHNLKDMLLLHLYSNKDLYFKNN